VVIDESKLSHIWIRTNTKEGLDRTGVAAVVILCFATEPESRVSLWYGRDKEKPDSAFDFLTPSVPIDVPDGEAKKFPCLFGGVSADMVKLAAAAQARLRAEMGKPGYGKLYRLGEKVEARG
jgi:hypothetical protein